MKKFRIIHVSIALVLAIFACACESSRRSEQTFTITKVQPEKDGQTLFLEDRDGITYTTVISIPNGNFIKVKEGDQVQLDIEEVLDTKPPIIISKTVTLVEPE